jgi:hypothetical protein
LGNLTEDAGAALLHHAGARRAGAAEIQPDDDELRAASRKVDGHALTLNLLGSFLGRAYHGDIRRRDRVKFRKADAKTQGGHAFRMLAAYERWLATGTEEGPRHLAVLRLMGLFDRPANASCLTALRREPIPGLTEPLAELANDDWEYCLSDLEISRLLTVNRDASNMLISLDTHPLIREYFAKQVSERAFWPLIWKMLHFFFPRISATTLAWRTAHRRLYEHLCATTPDKDQPTLENLQPLYQAILHACWGEQHDKATCDVFIPRILNGDLFYSVMKLGAVYPDLGALRAFLGDDWSREVANAEHKAMLLKHAGYCLRADGQLVEATKTLEMASREYRRLRRWSEAVCTHGLLSHVFSLLGDLLKAEKAAGECRRWAKNTNDGWVQITALSRMAEVQIKTASPVVGSGCHFQEAFDLLCVDQEREPEKVVCEKFQQAKNRDEQVGYVGFVQRYCDVLLAGGDFKGAAKWARLCQRMIEQDNRGHNDDFHLGLCEMFVGEALWGWAKDHSSGLKVKCLGRAEEKLCYAAKRFRAITRQHELPRVLLCRAAVRFYSGKITGPESAQADLDEAWEIAKRGPMRLFMADIHLSRARLFGRLKAEGGMLKYPWDKNPDGSPRGPADDLAAAEKLINDCGYHRRDEEIADAKKAIHS